MPAYDKKTLGDLIEGRLPWSTVKSIMSSHKDNGRFDTYLEILQEKVPWDEPILLPIGEHLSIVQTPEARVVRCDCGHEFGPYTENWKLSSLVRVRGSAEEIEEIYPGRYSCDPAWMELREFICPGCTTLLEVEAAPPGFPIVFDFLPDIQAFYHDWLGKPVPEASTT
jgi:acetone carboxylase, gamma subunit